jgi:hypothetical protein
VGVGAGVLLASPALVDLDGDAGVCVRPPSPPRYAYANVPDTKGYSARGGRRNPRLVCGRHGTSRMLQYLCTISTSMAADATYPLLLSRFVEI